MRFICILIFLLAGCDFSGLDTKKTGLHKVSQNIDESKNNGVFLFELHPDKRELNIGNKQTDAIEEAWVENLWMYQKEGGRTIVKKDTALQLAIRFKKLSSNTRTWVSNGISLLGWNGVAFGSFVNNSMYYVVQTPDTGQKIILDSFRLKR